MIRVEKHDSSVSLSNHSVDVAGKLIVDGREFNGRSQGNYQGLDLVSDLYVGGHPDFNRIAHSAGFREGFVGRYFSHFSWLFTFCCMQS